MNSSGLALRALTIGAILLSSCASWVLTSKWSTCGGTNMLRWLRAVVDWILGRRSSLVLLSLQALSPHGAPRNGKQGPDPPRRPYDPDSAVRAPKWHGPTDRTASAAVAEPVDDDSVVAIGRPHSVRGAVRADRPPSVHLSAPSSYKVGAQRDGFGSVGSTQ